MARDTQQVGAMEPTRRCFLRFLLSSPLLLSADGVSAAERFTWRQARLTARARMVPGAAAGSSVAPRFGWRRGKCFRYATDAHE